jgi:hypothetical protein
MCDGVSKVRVGVGKGGRRREDYPLQRGGGEGVCTTRLLIRKPREGGGRGWRREDYPLHGGGGRGLYLEALNKEATCPS